MNTHISRIFVLCMIVGVFGIGAAMAAPSVTIDPASTTGLSPGATFSVNIHVDPDGNGVSGGEICLSFDTAVLEVTDLTKGDMLGTGAFDTGSDYDNAAGTVIAVLARMGVTTPPTDAGTWATVTFQVKAGAADGTTTIAITSVGMVDESFADIIGITTTDGTATVCFTLHPGDIDGDGHVYLSDLMELADAFNSHPGDDDWNPCADLDCNGHIYLSDLMILADNFNVYY